MAAPVRECGVRKAPKVRAEYVYKALHPADRRDVGHATVVMTNKWTPLYLPKLLDRGFFLLNF